MTIMERSIATNRQAWLVMTDAEAVAKSLHLENPTGRTEREGGREGRVYYGVAATNRSFRSFLAAVCVPSLFSAFNSVKDPS